jgi:hypothetical protein
MYNKDRFHVPCRRVGTTGARAERGRLGTGLWWRISWSKVRQTSASTKTREKQTKITFGDRGGEGVLFVGHYGEKFGLFFLLKLVGVREHLKRKKEN